MLLFSKPDCLATPYVQMREIDRELKINVFVGMNFIIFYWLIPFRHQYYAYQRIQQHLFKSNAAQYNELKTNPIPHPPSPNPPIIITH